MKNFVNRASLFFMSVLCVVMSGCELNSKDGVYDCQNPADCIDAHPYCYAKNAGPLKCWSTPKPFIHDTDTALPVDSATFDDTPTDSDTRGNQPHSTDTGTAVTTANTTDDSFESGSPTDSDTISDNTDTQSDTDSGDTVTSDNETDTTDVPESDFFTDSDTDSNTDSNTDTDSVSDSASDYDSDTNAVPDSKPDTDSSTDTSSTPAEVPARPDPRLMTGMDLLHAEGITVFAAMPQASDATLAYVGTIAGNVYRIDDITASPFKVQQVDDWPGNDDFIPLPNLPVTAIAIDPDNTQNIYLTFAGINSSVTTAWRSLDGGESFTPLDTAPTYAVVNISVSPMSRNVLYLVSGTTIWASADYGDNWTDGPVADSLRNQLIDNERLSEDDLIATVSTYFTPDGKKMALVGTHNGNLIWVTNFNLLDAPCCYGTNVVMMQDDTPVRPDANQMVVNATAYALVDIYFQYANYHHELLSFTPHIWGTLSTENWWFAASMDGNPYWVNPNGTSINPFFSQKYTYIYDLYSECAYQGNEYLTEWTAICL